jgi:predicted RNA-binding Zn-ribbon protein involved in translation (DUF1610 family)
MKRKEFEEKYGYVNNEDDVNPLTEHEDHFFNKRVHKENKDYRELAIKKCLQNKDSFVSTNNSLWNLVKDYLKFQCPICGELLSFSGSSGSHGFYSSKTMCEKCKIEINLELPSDGITVTFK